MKSYILESFQFLRGDACSKCNSPAECCSLNVHFADLVSEIVKLGATSTFMSMQSVSSVTFSSHHAHINLIYLILWLLTVNVSTVVTTAVQRRALVGVCVCLCMHDPRTCILSGANLTY